MSSRTKRPNISPVPETNAKTTADLYREMDKEIRDANEQANLHAQAMVEQVYRESQAIQDAYQNAPQYLGIEADDSENQLIERVPIAELPQKPEPEVVKEKTSVFKKLLDFIMDW